jgi:hypothetical protein
MKHPKYGYEMMLPEAILQLTLESAMAAMSSSRWPRSRCRDSNCYQCVHELALLSISVPHRKSQDRMVSP